MTYNVKVNMALTLRMLDGKLKGHPEFPWLKAAAPQVTLPASFKTAGKWA